MQLSLDYDVVLSRKFKSSKPFVIKMQPGDPASVSDRLMDAKM